MPDSLVDSQARRIKEKLYSRFISERNETIASTFARCDRSILQSRTTMSFYYYFILRPESLRVLSSCANYGFYFLILAGITKSKYESKKQRDSGHSNKMTPAGKWPFLEQPVTLLRRLVYHKHRHEASLLNVQRMAEKNSTYP